MLHSIITRHASVDAWRADRVNGIGASEAPILAGVRAYGKGPAALYLAKVDGESDPDPAMVDRFRVGHMAEAHILDFLREFWGLHLQLNKERTHRHPEHAHHTCTPDALGAGLLHGVDLYPYGAEIKTTQPFIGAHIPRVAWGEVMDVGPDDNLFGPNEYKASLSAHRAFLSWYLQCQWCMHITGLDTWYLCVALTYSDLRVYRIHRDAVDIGLMAEAVDAFWWGNVVPRIPPPVDDAEFDAAWWRLTEVREEAAELPGGTDWQSLHAAYLVAASEAKAYQGMKDVIKRQFLRAMNGATIARVNDETVASIDDRKIFKFRKPRKGER